MVLAEQLLAAACAVRPPVWPTQFVLVQRRVPDANASVGLATTVTYYDYRAGANLILITPDTNASDVLWDLELDSGHSFYFTPARRTCSPMRFPVGILRPDWLANATLLGENITKNGRRCIGWTKQDFIDYYADAQTCEPVSWYFHSMRARFDTVYYRAGETATDPAMFEPPPYCPPAALT
uniref:Uncharacterized protein n=1 Tax=Calcidiscus leptoporus TaxID=127549 RepID=A0A7S0NMP4_9EUKA|mmetsp:Transcript_10467/g.24244  ORF Transcript_10467/g.24244 Transcript_10467/m.24244 type:complete len:181 (+) Transcript_10467:125-667(+)